MPKRKGTKNAKHLRRRMTDAERKLWYALRDRRFHGWKFRRQHPVGPYIADFACIEAQLIIEVDGGQHANSTTDAPRTQYLEAQGFRVIRLWNPDVLKNLDGVLLQLLIALGGPCPSPRPSPQRGEGD